MMNARDAELVEQLLILKDRQESKVGICGIFVMLDLLVTLSVAIGCLIGYDPLYLLESLNSPTKGAVAVIFAFFHAWAFSGLIVGGYKVDWYERRIGTIRKSYEDTATVNNLIRLNQRFAILLRGFAEESKFADIAMPGDPRHATPVEHTYHTELYETLLNPISKHMPVFELLNHHDFSKTSVVGRINWEEDWQACFQHYASSASLIIIIAESLTSGVAYELQWIKGTGREKVAILLATSTAQRNLKEAGLELTTGLRTIPEAGGSGLQIVTVTASLVAELEGIARDAANGSEVSAHCAERDTLGG